MKTKKILNIISICLLVVSLALLISCLVSYYKYVGTIKEITSTEIDLIKKFELQSSKENYLYKTLTMLVWAAYVSILSILTAIVSLVISSKKENVQKFR